MNHPAPMSATEIAAMVDHPDFLVATKCAAKFFDMLKEKLPKAAPFLDLNRLTDDLCGWTEAMREAASPGHVQVKTYARLLEKYTEEAVARFSEEKAAEAELRVQTAMADLGAALSGEKDQSATHPKWVWEAAAYRLGVLKAH